MQGFKTFKFPVPSPDTQPVFFARYFGLT